MMPTRIFLVAALDGAQLFLRGLRFERHLVAREFERLFRRAGRGARGSTCRRTCVPARPRMSCTTSSMRQPSTSVTGPSLPWPTPVMRSLTDSVRRRPPGRLR
jgi:hypothetical protein